MPFLQSLDADTSREKKLLKEMNLKEDENLFNVPNHHPATHLRFIVIDFKDWIYVTA